MDKKEKQKIVDSIVQKCTVDAKCEDRHNQRKKNSPCGAFGHPIYGKGFAKM